MSSASHQRAVRLKLWLQSQAAAALMRLKSRPACEASISVDNGETRLTMSAGPLNGTGENGTHLPPFPAQQFFLSPIEQQSLRFIAARGKATGKAVGRATGNLDARGEATTILRAILRNLCDRGILDSNDDGYCITEGFKPLVREMLGDLNDTSDS
jgi:hypothetical protein